MMSVRHFKDRQRKLATDSFTPSIRLFNNKKITPWDKCLRSLLISSPTPAMQLKKCRDEFQLLVQSGSTQDERRIVMKFMREAWLECLQQNNLALTVEQYSNIIFFVVDYSFKKIHGYSWAHEMHVYNATSVDIIKELCAFSNEVGWYLFNNIDKKNQFLAGGILLNIIRTAINAAYAHLTYAKHLWITLGSVDNSSLQTLQNASDENSVFLESEIETSAKSASDKINQLIGNLSNCASYISDVGLLYQVERMLFSSYSIRAKLALKRGQLALVKDLIRLCEDCSIIKNKHNTDKAFDEYTQLKQAVAVFEQKPPVIAATPVKPSLMPQGSEVQATSLQHALTPRVDEAAFVDETMTNVKKLTHKERESARKKQKKIAKIASIRTKESADSLRTPKCYMVNESLRHLLNKISDTFNRASCDGYLYGSANYKSIPNDFDILVPNIKSDEDRKKVSALIKLFEEQGGVVTAMDAATGAQGYKKSDRYIIPMEWNGCKIDFNISAKDYVDHGPTLDFTVGALYFDLRQKQMYRLSSLSSLYDMDRKRIQTISDPRVSFRSDPSRIFRAVRLIAGEGFYLSNECADAIQEIASSDENIFNSMKVGKVYQQLALLFASGREKENIAELHRLGFFFKLCHLLSERTDRTALAYLQRLEPYCVDFRQQHAYVFQVQTSNQRGPFFQTPPSQVGNTQPSMVHLGKYQYLSVGSTCNGVV